jgi:hypothetical protein
VPKIRVLSTQAPSGFSITDQVQRWDAALRFHTDEAPLVELLEWFPELNPQAFSAPESRENMPVHNAAVVGTRHIAAGQS